MQSLADFYRAAYGDKSQWKEYESLRNQVLKKYLKMLTPAQERAFGSGNCNEVAAVLKTDKAKSVQAFIKAVQSDPSYVQMDQVCKDMVKKHGSGLTPEQKKIVLSGDARKISHQIAQERKAAGPVVPTAVEAEIVTWNFA